MTRRWILPAVAAVAVLAVVVVVAALELREAGGGTGGSSGPRPTAPASSGPPDPTPSASLDPTGGPTIFPGPDGKRKLSETLPLDGYHVSGGNRLDLIYTTGVPECYGRAGRPEVVETARSVTVTVPRELPEGGPAGACVDQAVIDSVRVRLERPVGDRSVLDGAQGRPGASAGVHLDPERLPGQPRPIQ